MGKQGDKSEFAESEGKDADSGSEKRVVKKVKRKVDPSKVLAPPEKQALDNDPISDQNETEYILLKVKRRRAEDTTDSIHLEFDQLGGLKRTKVVTEKEAIANALSLFSLDPPQKTSLLKFDIGKKTETKNLKLNKIRIADRDLFDREGKS